MWACEKLAVKSFARTVMIIIAKENPQRIYIMFEHFHINKIRVFATINEPQQQNQQHDMCAQQIGSA